MHYEYMWFKSMDGNNNYMLQENNAILSDGMYKQYSKTCLKWLLKERPQNMFFKTNTRLMQVGSIAECSLEYSAILSTCTKLPPVFKTFVLSIFEWPL